ncbi:MAG: FecR family protein, partial [Terriglobales bacterium]
MKTPRILVMMTALVLMGILVLPTAQQAFAQEPPPPAQPEAAPAPPEPADAQEAQTPEEPDQAEAAPDASPAQDPPGRVARLSYSSGSVSFQPGGQGDWVTAVENRPLTTGDNLWADKDSRAEFQIGSTSARMDSETSVTFLQVDDQTTQLRLSQGSLIFRVRHLDDGDHFEIDTPNSAFQVQRTGEYRVDVNSAGNETDVTVWKGRGEVTGGGDSFVVIAGQRATFIGTDKLDHEIG